MTDQPNAQQAHPYRAKGAWATGILVFVTAVVMGLPTLRGTFVGADDHRLVLNHVLVNHPSFDHALELFKVVHRDLYQPLPLLSFSIEFAIAGELGLFDEGVASGAWLFHLTNVILHALNAVLVWAVVLSFSAVGKRDGWQIPNALSSDPSAGTKQLGRAAESALPVVATLAGLLFAIHPLQVEVVAWVNGRMMLLSTLFALASLVALSTWLRTGRHRWAVFTVLFVLCCVISKIRVGLPFLLLIVPIVQRRKLTRAFGLLWMICLGITALFAWVNYSATADAGMFEGAVANLHGPRAARAFLALAWYFQHFLVPCGLASWYPTPGLVQWTDPAVVRAILVVGGVVALMGWTALRSRNAALGYFWFFATIASTVQLVPTRNALAADRYMYLPIIGLVWVVSMALARSYGVAVRRWSRQVVRTVAAGVGAVVVVVLVGLSWHTASFYETPILKGTRIASLAPTIPHVWERVAWAYNRAERYGEAIDIAQREFAHDDVSAQSAAFQVIGASQLRLGQTEKAMASLQRAIDIDPEPVTAKHRFATALHELGRTDEALPLFEFAVAKAPMKNPWIVRLASLYRELGLGDKARPLYEQALENNPYEVPAILGLAEMDIDVGIPEALMAAEGRLTGLLKWMPENSIALVDLGVVYHAQGRTTDAIRAYHEALELEPGNAIAALNLAEIYNGSGDHVRAKQYFEHAVSQGVESIEHAKACHDFFIAQRTPKRAVDMWVEFTSRYPESLEGRSFLAWSRALSGDYANAAAHAEAMVDGDPPMPLAVATLAYVGLATAEYDVANTWADRLCAAAESGVETRQRLLRALGAIVQQRPDDPWAFCVAAKLWMADGHIDPGAEFIALCEQRCRDARCTELVEVLRTRLTE